MVNRERREVFYSGSVQGVGFRYTTQSVARRFEVGGFVKNLPDGRVQLVVEGERSVLDEFLDAVATAMNGHITNTQVNEPRFTGEFTKFDISF